MKILLVEDEAKLASSIKKGMEKEGYELDIAYDGMLGSKMIHSKTYDVAILDVNIPCINGYDLCKELRQKNNTIPVMMLTAFDSIDDKLAGFEAGADDYLAKPFAFLELVARVKALTRRKNINTGKKRTLYAGDLILETETKTVSRGNKEITLTWREYSLLEYLLINKGRVLTKKDLFENVWDFSFDTNTNIIEVYITYLRNKIEKNYNHKLIHNVRAMGYMIKEPSYVD